MKPRCAQCEEHKTVLIVMAPGKDGQEWYLCVRCYTHGGQKPTSKRRRS